MGLGLSALEVDSLLEAGQLSQDPKWGTRNDVNRVGNGNERFHPGGGGSIGTAESSAHDDDDDDDDDDDTIGYGEPGGAPTAERITERKTSRRPLPPGSSKKGTSTVASNLGRGKGGLSAAISAANGRTKGRNQRSFGADREGVASISRPSEEENALVAAAAAAVRRRQGGTGHGGGPIQETLSTLHHDGAPSGALVVRETQCSFDEDDSDDAQEEESLEEYHETAPFRKAIADQSAKDEALYEKHRRHEPRHMAVTGTTNVESNRPAPGSPAAASALQDILAAAGGLVGSGSDAKSNPAAVAALLEQLAAQARLLAGGAPAGKSLETPKHAEAQLAVPRSGTVRSARETVLQSSGTIRSLSEIPASRCSVCGLLPVARRCLDCGISGCAACWAREHGRLGLANKGHRFELQGGARSQVSFFWWHAHYFFGSHQWIP